ncbi:MAG: hypothetical protein ACWGNV_08735 [Bacteroidales bacterium]
MNSKSHLYQILAALLLVHLLFFTSSRLFPPNPLPDSEEYLNASQNLFTQGVLYSGDLSEPIRDELFTRRPPLYPLMIGPSAASGSVVPVYLIQIILSLISIWVVADIFGPTVKENFPRRFPEHPSQATRTFNLLLFLLLLATPAQFIYANRLMAEIPFQLILVLMACCVYRYFYPAAAKETTETGKGEGSEAKPPANHKRRYVWSFYLLLTLGMATKPVLFPFLLPMALLSGFMFFRTRRRVWITALSLPVLWIGAYSLYNFNRTGSAQYASIQTANLVNYNLRYYLVSREGSEKAAMEVDGLYERCEDQGSYREKNQCLTEGVREVLLKHPIQYGIFHLKGSVRYFLDPGRFDLATFFQLDRADSTGALNVLHEEGAAGFIRFLKSQGFGMVLALAVIALFKLFKLTGFVIYLFRGRQELAFRIFLALLVGYLALVTGPLGASRFYLPVELLVIGASLKGWLQLLGRNFWPQKVV